MTRTRKLPPLPKSVPKSVPSVLGRVPVTRIKNLKDERGRGCFGICRYDTRTIRLESDMSETTAWHTYWHEWAHMVMWDAGLSGAADTLKERMCDAFANARVREMLDGEK